MSSTMIRPWKIVRIVLWGAFAWFVLALLWAFLPFPASEHDGDNGTDYATSVLRAGKTLTRVYDSTRSPFSHDNPRRAFALDYKVDLTTLTLSISDVDKPIPIIYHDDAEAESADITLDITVQARVGDTDGANLPWFEYADSVLLFWWIDKEIVDLPLSVSWSVEVENIYIMDLKYAGRHVADDPLLSIRMRGNDTSSFEATVPARPLSSSPSWTYPIRVVILNIIAPVAIFVNDYLGDPIPFLFRTTFTVVEVLFIILVYVFVVMTIVVSIYRCVGGPSLEVIVLRTHDGLEVLKQNERLRFLHVETVQESLDRLYHNKRIQVVIGVCRNGWHPERDRERAAREVEADIERASSSQEERPDTEKRGSNKDASAPML